MGDARFLNQTLREAKFFICTERWTGERVPLMRRRVIPIHVYPCPGDDERFCEEQTMWNLDHSSLTPLPTARIRYEIIAANCFGGTPCDAYEKAQRLCVGKLAESHYKCWYMRGVSMGLASVGCGLFAFRMMRNECRLHGPREMASHRAPCCGCFLVLLVVVTILVHFTPAPPSPPDNIPVEVANLTRYDENGGVVLPEEQPVPGTPVWQTVLQTLGLICALCICCFGKDEEDEDERRSDETGSDRRLNQELILRSKNKRDPICV